MCFLGSEYRKKVHTACLSSFGYWCCCCCCAPVLTSSQLWLHGYLWDTAFQQRALGFVLRQRKCWNSMHEANWEDTQVSSPLSMAAAGRCSSGSRPSQAKVKFAVSASEPVTYFIEGSTCAMCALCVFFIPSEERKTRHVIPPPDHSWRIPRLLTFFPTFSLRPRNISLQGLLCYDQEGNMAFILWGLKANWASVVFSEEWFSVWFCY